MTTEFILDHDEKFIQCPYNVSHQVTNARMLRHLKKCREDFLKKLTETQQKDVMRKCRLNALHHVPEPELKLHENLLCSNTSNVVSYLAYHESDAGKEQYKDRQQHEHEIRKRRRSPTPPPKYPHYSDKKNYHERVYGDSKYSSSKRRDEEKYKSKTTTSSSSRNDIEEEDWEAESSGYVPGYDPQQKLKTETVVYIPQGMTKSERKKFREDHKERALKRFREPNQRRASDNTSDEGDNSVREVETESNNDRVSESSQYSRSQYDSTRRCSPDRNSGRNSTSNAASSSTSSSSSRHSSSYSSYSHSRHGYTSHSSSSSRRSRTVGSWYDRDRDRRRDYSSDDSDSFQGIDPYA